MSIEITWHDEAQTLLLFKFLPNYTWDDLARAMQQGQIMMKELPQKVDWLFYGEGDKQTIPRGNPWHMLRAAQQKIPANTGRLCVVNPGLFVKMMQRIGEKTIPESIELLRFAPTFDEALALLLKERAAGEMAG